MKKSHIFVIVIIAVAIAIIISTADDASTYVNFTEAYQIASTGNAKSIHVVGALKKNSQGDVVGIQNGMDHVSFSFLLVDEQGREQKVFYDEPMPPDFTRSEKIVIVGGYKDDQFVADKIILKCPSKYQEQKLSAGV